LRRFSYAEVGQARLPLHPRLWCLHKESKTWMAGSSRGAVIGPRFARTRWRSPGHDEGGIVPRALSNPIVKQPGASAINSLRKSRASSVLIFVCPLSPERFSFALPPKRAGARLHSHEREQSAIKRTRDACSDEAGDQPCDRPASPYGAPPRRLKFLGAPLPVGPGRLSPGPGRCKGH
jgi:hypothetical protein